MRKTVSVYKPVGKTPLEAIESFREQNPEYKDVKLGYAGRLDPMAEGVLLVLVGEELKNQKAYWALDKEYEADILFGFTTDTYDVLGIPKIENPNPNVPMPNKDQIQKILKEFDGEYTFSYPAYSSRKVKGKPLFWWARRGMLDEIEIPQKTVQVYKTELLGTKQIQKGELQDIILQKINSVKGNFRQKKIKTAWKKVFKESTQENFVIIKATAFVSSGTYIRTLADDLGKKMGAGAVLLNLKRTKVDKHTIKKSIKIS